MHKSFAWLVLKGVGPGDAPFDKEIKLWVFTGWLEAQCPRNVVNNVRKHSSRHYNMFPQEMHAVPLPPSLCCGVLGVWPQDSGISSVAISQLTRWIKNTCLSKHLPPILLLLLKLSNCCVKLVVQLKTSFKALLAWHRAWLPIFTLLVVLHYILPASG